MLSHNAYGKYLELTSFTNMPYYTVSFPFKSYILKSLSREILLIWRLYSQLQKKNCLPIVTISHHIPVDLPKQKPTPKTIAASNRCFIDFSVDWQSAETISKYLLLTSTKFVIVSFSLL